MLVFWDHEYSLVKIDTRINKCRIVALFSTCGRKDIKKISGIFCFGTSGNKKGKFLPFCHGGQATTHEIGRSFKELVIARFGTDGTERNNM